MSISELWTLTMNNTDLSLRWTGIGFLFQAVQTIILLGTAYITLTQVKQSRDEERMQRRVYGLKKAIEVLDNDLFNRISKQVTSGKEVKGSNWSQLLDSINLVALLVEQGYTDSTLLLSLKGKQLYGIGNYIQKNGLPKDIQGKKDGQYKPALEYLEGICKHAKKLGYID